MTEAAETPETEVAASAQETEPLSFKPPEVLPDAPVTTDETPKPEVETAEGDTVSAVESEVTQPATAVPENDAAPLVEPLVTDDNSKSIWERFGVPRPAEIEPPPAITPEPEATVETPTPAVEEPAAAAVPVALPTVVPQRIGLRIVLRRKLVRLRRPSATP